MSAEHLRLCASAEWEALVADELLPWVLGDGGRFRFRARAGAGAAARA